MGLRSHPPSPSPLPSQSLSRAQQHKPEEGSGRALGGEGAQGRGWLGNWAVELLAIVYFHSPLWDGQEPWDVNTWGYFFFSLGEPSDKIAEQRQWSSLWSTKKFNTSCRFQDDAIWFPVPSVLPFLLAKKWDKGRRWNRLSKFLCAKSLRSYMLSVVFGLLVIWTDTSILFLQVDIVMYFC